MAKRATRFKRKYVVDPLTKRAKKLLPVMYPLMKDALVDWDKLEQYLFPKFEELGIPSEEYDFYLAWAKRKGHKGLRFDQETRVLEVEILKQEFITRGLDEAKLDVLEPVVDTWISEMRGVLCPFEFIDGFDTGDLSKWTPDTSGYGHEITTLDYHHSPYCAKSNGLDGGLVHPLASESAKYYIRIWFKITGSVPTSLGSTEWIGFYASDWSEVLRVHIRTGGAITPKFRLEGRSGSYMDGTTAIILEEWHCVVIECDGDKASAIHRLWLDGNLEISLSDVTTGGKVKNLEYWSVYWSGAYTGRLEIDCHISDPSTQPECSYYEGCKA